LLRDAGLVAEERSGAFSWYRLSDGLAADGARPSLHAWLADEFAKTSATTRADDGRLEEVRRLRKESFRGVHGDERRQLVPGRSWAAWARALGLLLPAVDVADLGCGEGHLTVEAARWARHVTAVDRSTDVLGRGRDLAKRRKLTNITWKRGELERLPIKDATMDVALLSQALHHAGEPERALSEACRILRPGGRVLLLELREHEEAWVRAKLGDRWLGFSDARLRGLLQGAGFHNPVVRIGARRSADPFAVSIAAATKNGDTA
jgi:ArsR family transcriptional regulator